MRTFNLVVLAILGLFFAACDDDDHLGDWGKAIQFSGSPREAAVCFTDATTGTVFVGLGYGANSEEFSDMYEFNGTSWTALDTKFPADDNPTPPNSEDPGKVKNGNGRHSAVAFVIGDYAYVGLGYVTAFNGYLSNSTDFIDRDRTFFRDFYRFNMKTKQWDGSVKITPFPGEQRRDAVAFSDGSFGYVGTGAGYNNRVYRDFYKFNPNGTGEGGTIGSWEAMDALGDARYGATAFVINNAAYVCLGSNSATALGTSSYVLDVVKYDFASGAWSKMGSLADKPGVKQDKDYGRIPRAYAISFISDKGKDGEPYAYIACGVGAQPRTVWKYNHKKDQWHQMEDLSNYASSVVGAVGFSIGGYGWYTTGAASMDASTASNFYIDSWKFVPDIKEDRANDY